MLIDANKPTVSLMLWVFLLCKIYKFQYFYNSIERSTSTSSVSLNSKPAEPVEATQSWRVLSAKKTHFDKLKVLKISMQSYIQVI